MSISPGEDILAADFKTTSTGASDAGKGVRFNGVGRIKSVNIQSGFGGDGSDGALSIPSGTTTIDASGANVVIKNYTSINIAAGATLALSNPAAGGTILILKCTGDVTIEGLIDLEGMGANSVTDGYGILDDNSHNGANGANGSGGSGGAGGAGSGATQYINKQFYLSADALRLYQRFLAVATGSGGGAGGNGSGSSGSAGGKGGGGLIIECAGALDFDAGGEIKLNGNVGVVGGTGGGAGSGGGGGGTAGMALILYATLTDNSGTVNAKGGAGGAGGAGGTPNSGLAGGGGGSGSGSYTAVGKNGGAGGDAGANPGVAGVNTNDASGAGGGGGGGDASSPAGGAGGTQGATDANHYIVVQNNVLV